MKHSYSGLINKKPIKQNFTADGQQSAACFDCSNGHLQAVFFQEGRNMQLIANHLK
jgi:hypothetical protein